MFLVFIGTTCFLFHQFIAPTMSEYPEDIRLIKIIGDLILIVGGSIIFELNKINKTLKLNNLNKEEK